MYSVVISIPPARKFLNFRDFFEVRIVVGMQFCMCSAYVRIQDHRASEVAGVTSIIYCVGDFNCRVRTIFYEQ